MAGWIYMQIDHPPQVGDLVREGNYEFLVHEVDHYRITRVVVKKLEEETTKIEEEEK